METHPVNLNDKLEIVKLFDCVALLHCYKFCPSCPTLRPWLQGIIASDQLPECSKYAQLSEYLEKRQNLFLEKFNFHLTTAVIKNCVKPLIAKKGPLTERTLETAIQEILNLKKDKRFNSFARNFVADDKFNFEKLERALVA